MTATKSCHPGLPGNTGTSPIFTLPIIIILFMMIMIGCNRSTGGADDRFPLGEKMGNLQYYSAKLYFAGHSGNWDLARYYRAELAETAEDIEKANPEKDGIRIGRLIDNNLNEASRNMDNAIAAGNRTDFEKSYNTLIQSCNRCHEETRREFIRITIPAEKEGPWNQDFRPRKKVPATVSRS